MLQLLSETLPDSGLDFESILDDKSEELTLSLALFSVISGFDRVQVNSFKNIRPSTGKQPVQLSKSQGAKGHFWELSEQVWAQIWRHCLLLTSLGAGHTAEGSTCRTWLKALSAETAQRQVLNRSM